MSKSITIGHLYPDLLNLYGDRGNIQCMVKRLQWRGIDAKVKEFRLGDPIDFKELDIVLMGGGSDREQMIVCNKLREIQKDFKEYVEDDGVVLAVCGGYQLLGKYYQTSEGTITGLDLVDLYTEQKPERLINNIVIKSDLFEMPVVGFENHGDGPLSGTTSLLEKSFTDQATMTTADMKVWSTKMCRHLYPRTAPAEKSTALRLAFGAGTGTEIQRSGGVRSTAGCGRKRGKRLHLSSVCEK